MKTNSIFFRYFLSIAFVLAFMVGISASDVSAQCSCDFPSNTTLSGKVINVDTQAPIGRALVSLTDINSNTVIATATTSTATGQVGTFSFTGLNKCAAYQLSAEFKEFAGTYHPLGIFYYNTGFAYATDGTLVIGLDPTP